MSNRNATASWSGFSHQGQVGLLVALKEIIKLRNADKGNQLTNYFVEYENKEDAAIYNIDNGNTNYLSVHQVKAYYSNGNNTKSKYSGVLNGTFDTCGNDYLHTVVNIDDWNTSATTNTNGIERFEYSNGVFHCDTTSIEEKVKEEILLLLGNNIGRVNSAYSRITLALDTKIRTEHKKASKALFDIKFSFQEIFDIIDSDAEFVDQNIFESRKAFYDAYQKYLELNDIPEDRIELISNSILDPIYRLDNSDFKMFLIRLNLHEDPDKIELPQYNFNPTGFKQVFFKVLFNVIAVSPELKEQSIEYCKEGYSESYVLTTIIEEVGDKESVVVNIIKNLDALNLLWDNHAIINKEIDGKLYDLNPKINNIPIEDLKDKDKFMGFSKRSRLITRDDATNNLNDE